MKPDTRTFPKKRCISSCYRLAAFCAIVWLCSNSQGGIAIFQWENFAPYSIASAQPVETEPQKAWTIGERLCPGVYLRQGDELSLSDTEKRLVCGKADEDDRKQPAPWRQIPFNQAKFHLKAFAQSEGHYDLEFQEQGSKLVVKVGRETKVSEIVTSDAPETLEIWRRRNLIDSTLTPAFLNQVEAWVYAQLQSHGYPCPEVDTLADSESGKVTVGIDSGPKLPFYAVEEAQTEGMRSGTLRRYDAFVLGQPFDANLLTLTSNRILRDGVVQSVYFTEECTPKGALVRQHVNLGPPRLLRFGFGIDAEGLIRGRAVWQNARMGQSASIFSVRAEGSTIEQVLDASFRWYFAPESRRLYLEPSLEIRHQNEKPFETISTTAQLSPGRTWESPHHHYEAEVGPAFSLFRTLRGTGPSDSQFLTLDFETSVANHDHEFYERTPREGYAFQLLGSLAHDDLVSDASAQQFRLFGQTLWNYRDYDPPLWILGFRFGLSSTLVADRAEAIASIPPNFLYFLGSSATIRGFGRNEITRANGVGGLSSVFAGLEWRMNFFAPYSLQPFLFVDGGALGENSLDFASSPLYWSPGLGMRWESPIGSIRATLAHGYVTGAAPAAGPDQDGDFEHLQFYFSFGEEF